MIHIIYSTLNFHVEVVDVEIEYIIITPNFEN